MKKPLQYTLLLLICMFEACMGVMAQTDTTTTLPAGSTAFTPSWRWQDFGGKQLMWQYNSAKGKYYLTPTVQWTRAQLAPIITQQNANTAAIANTNLQTVTQNGNTTTVPVYLNVNNTPAKSIVILSDSYGASYGLTFVNQGYPNLLASSLKMSLSNFSVSGTLVEKQTPINATGGTNLIDQMVNIPNYSTSVGWLVIALGLNDVRYTGTNYTLSNYNSDYTTALNYIINTKGYPANKILLVTPWYVTPTSYVSVLGTAAADYARHKTFINATKTLATNFGTKIFDAYGFESNNGKSSLMQSDSIHQNPIGHKLISIGIMQALGYEVRVDGQQLAANGKVEFNNLNLAVPDTLAGKTAYDLVLDSAGNFRRLPGGNIRSNLSATAQDAVINISGSVTSPLGKFTSINTTGPNTFSGSYLKIAGNGAYPASRNGWLFTNQGASGGAMDVYDNAGVSRTLSIQTFGTGNTVIGNTTGVALITGNVVGLGSAGGTMTFGAPITNVPVFQGGTSFTGYQVTRLGTTIGFFSGQGYIDATTTTGVATALNLQAFTPGGTLNAGNGTGLTNINGSTTTITSTVNTILRSAGTGLGTITTVAGGTSVTGSGTTFLTSFAPGQIITANGETRTIASIASNTSMTTDAWVASNTAVSYLLGTISGFQFNPNGKMIISVTPATSAGAYDILTRNSTGVVEKIASTTFATTAANALKLNITDTTAAFANLAHRNTNNTMTGNNVFTKYVELPGAAVIKPTNGPSVGTGNAYINVSTTAPNVFNFTAPNTGGTFLDLSNTSDLTRIARLSDVTGNARTPVVVSANSTMTLNADYLNTTATQYTLTLPPTTGFATDGSKIITVLATGTGGVKISVPSGYSMTSPGGAATTTGTGGTTITQYQKIQLIPVGTNAYQLQPLNGTVTVF